MTHISQRFLERKTDFTNCVARLQEAVAQPETSFIRDSVIKRYECAWETGWKLLKLWLSYQGITANSPRDVWKEAFALGLLPADADVWETAQRMRNLTVHTYDEDLAREVYNFICTVAASVFNTLCDSAQTWHIAS